MPRPSHRAIIEAMARWDSFVTRGDRGLAEAGNPHHRARVEYSENTIRVVEPGHGGDPGGVDHGDLLARDPARRGRCLADRMLLYPVYYCLGNAAIALLIVSRAGTARPSIP